MSDSPSPGYEAILVSPGLAFILRGEEVFSVCQATEHFASDQGILAVATGMAAFEQLKSAAATALKALSTPSQFNTAEAMAQLRDALAIADGTSLETGLRDAGPAAIGDLSSMTPALADFLRRVQNEAQISPRVESRLNNVLQNQSGVAPTPEQLRTLLEDLLVWSKLPAPFEAQIKSALFGLRG